MRTVKAKYRKKFDDYVAKCPYCGYLNINASETDSCKHLYELIVNYDVVFYFAKDVMPMRIG